METESKRTREESKRISQLREQQLLETINKKRQKVRFMREVIPAQRKLAKLVRPDSKTNAKVSIQAKEHEWSTVVIVIVIYMTWLLCECLL